uniref:Reverse transcriptase n=1 Tax=Cannabis sativa TaxID=3483 RepID=A0A803NJP8_CANSA
MKAPTRRQSFLTTFPWLRSGKGGSETTGQTTSVSPAVNASTKFKGMTKDNCDPQSNQPISKLNGQSRTYGNQKTSLKDHVKLVNDNSAKFSTEEIVEISYLKRKRMAGISHVGPIILTNGIMETKVDVVERFKIRVGFKGCFSIVVNGRKGGLSMLWRISDETHLTNYSNNHIDVEVRIPGVAKWRLFGFYGEPNRNLRYHTWNLLRSMAAESSLPWCVIGDFNNIISNDDKKGGRPYPATLISSFQVAVMDSHLIDLELRGYQYTWERSRGTNRNVEIRLDRAMVTQQWLDMFNEVSLTNLAFSSSDHSPIFLEPKIMVSGTTMGLFRYENSWIREPLCAQIVTDVLHSNQHKHIMSKLDLCGKQFAIWGRSISVNANHNDALLQSMRDEEVKSVVFSMHLDNPVLTKNFVAMSDLRPISLCNVLYKIISKVLASRMRDLIDDIISDTKRTFMPGRLMSENVMIAFEVTHYLKHKRKGKKGFMDLKLDMSKAYDRVEWDFLRAVMLRMGFSSRWVDLIMACVSTFEAKRIIQGCRVAHLAQSITHMLFTNDSYFFCQASENAAASISNLLDLFESASGQKVNPSKSSIFYSPNIDGTTRLRICSTFHMNEAIEGSLYLGLPNIICRNKNAIARVNSWDGKFLSRAGKEILLKTVIQSLLTYAMSVFLLPLGRGIIWMSWDRLAKPKEEGGMGFRHLHDFNLAMLAKQGWRLLCNPDSLASRVYKAKYFPHSDFLSAKLGNSPSFVWRSIWGAQHVACLGTVRTIGDGTSTNILCTPWLPNQKNKCITSSHPSLQHNSVNSLFQINDCAWDIDVVTNLFPTNEANITLGIPLSRTAGADFWSWIADHVRSFLPAWRIFIATT